MARKRNSIGCLFYVALVLLVLVVFLFNRTRVQRVIEKTGFTRLFERKRGAPAEVVVTPPPQQAPGAAGRSGRSPAPEAGPAPPPVGAARPSSEVVVELVKPAAKDGAATGPTQEQRQKPAAGQGETPSPGRTRQARLFFIAVKPDGGIQMKSVIRPVKYTDAPLTSTLQALLAGPTPAEVNQGLMSLVAPEARLRRAQVKDGTAYLDFSEAFRFNSLGKEGLSAQLRQVVYSATEFSTVKRVQILLEGKTSEYLGPEGLYIGKPLSRQSFQ
jgi:spore germination protein GerM